MQGSGRWAVVLAALALAGPLVAGLAQAAGDGAPVPEGHHLLVQVTNEADETRELTVDVEGPVKREIDLSLAPGETVRERIDGPEGVYDVDLVRSSATMGTARFGMGEENTTGCPGTYRFTFALIPGPGVSGRGAGCLATPARFTELMDQAEDALGTDPESMVTVPTPGASDAGRYRTWRTLDAPDPGKGDTLTFRVETGASFRDAWGRTIEGDEIAYHAVEVQADEPGGFEADTPNLVRYRPGRTSPLAYTAFNGFTGTRDSSGETAFVDWEIRYDEAVGWPGCLLRHPLQGTTVDPGSGSIDARLCGGSWTAGEVYETRGFTVLPLYQTGSIDDQRTVRRILLADGLAYPLAAERYTAGGGEAADHVAYTLTRLNETAPPDTPAQATPAGPLPVPTAPIDPLEGPALGEAGDRVPFTLAEASQAARSDPRLTQLADLLESEDVVLAGAALGHVRAAGDEGAQLAWWMAFTTPEDRVSVLCQRPGPANRSLALPSLDRPRTPVADCAEDVEPPSFAGAVADPPAWDRAKLPDRGVSFGAAIDRWETADAASSDEPVTAAIYRPWTRSDRSPAILQVGRTVPDDAPPAIQPSGHTRGTGVALDLDTGRTVTERVTERTATGLIAVPTPLQGANAAPDPGFDPVGEDLPVLVGTVAGIGLIGLVVYLLTTGGGPLAGLYTRLTREEVVDHPAREAILALLDDEPGLHARAIARRVDANDRTAEYHLDRLLREDLVTALERGGYTHYFLPGEHGPRQMQALASLHRGRSEEVFEAIRQDPGIDLSTLAERVDVSKAYASKMVSNLVETGLVDKIRDGRRSTLYANDVE